jgi:hypothetical protein
MADAQTKAGGCHCGAVRFEADVDLTQTVSCNCSHCAMKGFVLTAVPASALRVQSGEEKLTEYRFNTKKIAHLFCSVCGAQPFSRGEGPDGSKMAMVNARCLDGVDLASLSPVHFDGKSY